MTPRLPQADWLSGNLSSSSGLWWKPEPSHAWNPWISVVGNLTAVAFPDYAMKRIEIRAAEAADAVLIVDFIRQLAEYERLSNECLVTEAAIQEHLFGDRPCAEALIVSSDDRPVGFALFFHNFSTFLAKPGIYIEDLYVEPEARGKGHGKALLKRIFEIARERDCGRVEWSVLNWNEPAIRFYESLGAKPMNEWTVYRVADGAVGVL